MLYRACVVDVFQCGDGFWEVNYIEVSPWCNLELAENWLAAFENRYLDNDFVFDIEENDESEV